MKHLKLGYKVLLWFSLLLIVTISNRCVYAASKISKSTQKDVYNVYAAVLKQDYKALGCKNKISFMKKYFPDAYSEYCFNLEDDKSYTFEKFLDDCLYSGSYHGMANLYKGDTKFLLRDLNGDGLEELITTENVIFTYVPKSKKLICLHTGDMGRVYATLYTDNTLVVNGSSGAGAWSYEIFKMGKKSLHSIKYINVDSDSKSVYTEDKKEITKKRYEKLIDQYVTNKKEVSQSKYHKISEKNLNTYLSIK